MMAVWLQIQPHSVHRNWPALLEPGTSTCRARPALQLPVVTLRRVTDEPVSPRRTLVVDVGYPFHRRNSGESYRSRPHPERPDPPYLPTDVVPTPQMTIKTGTSIWVDVVLHRRHRH